MNRARDGWIDWLSRQRFSAWESFREPYEGSGRIRRHPWRPETLSPTFQTSWVKEGLDRAPAPYLEPRRGDPRSGWLYDRLIEDATGAWRTANRLDCADFGNRSLYCAIGAFGVEERPDLSRLVKVCGPRKRDIPLSPPHYDLPGGHAYRAIDAARLLLYGCSYRAGGRMRTLLFRDLPIQRQRRVAGAAIVVTTVENGEVRITMIDFAPRDPDLCLACRVFVAEDLGGPPLDGLEIHHLLVNSRGSWTVSDAPDGALLEDREDGTGLRLFSPGFGARGDAGLLGAEPERAWQRFHLPLRLTAVDPSGARTGWSLLVPRIAGGDPDSERAEQAAPVFDPRRALEATRLFWADWSSRVAFGCDRPVLADLVDGLPVLLKTHEGDRGFHLGTTYQRHTHCWSRDNYLMQRGLLAGGRLEEAEGNLRGFRACWSASGIACGYHVFSGANWIPRPTPEICSYLVLMARDVELWTGAPPPAETWEMIADCADALTLNSRGLVGFDGDEIWFWELDPRLFADADGRSLRDPAILAEFCVLDNCWLAAAALSYAERAARRREAAAHAERWAGVRRRLEQSMERELWDPLRGVYTAFLFPDGRRYGGALTSGYCTPAFFGVPERRPGSYRAMARECLSSLMSPEGVVKGNPDTEVYAGMTPALLLHALGSAGARSEGDRYLRDLVRSLPSSGGTWEYSLVDLPYTGTDKRRGGDSGVLLAALLDYLVGFRPDWAGFTVRPHVPASCRRISVAGLRARGRRVDVEADRRGARVFLDGRLAARVSAGGRLAWDAATGTTDVAAEGGDRS